MSFVVVRQIVIILLGLGAFVLNFSAERPRGQFTLFTSCLVEKFLEVVKVEQISCAQYSLLFGGSFASHRGKFMDLATVEWPT